MVTLLALNANAQRLYTTGIKGNSVVEYDVASNTFTRVARLDAISVNQPLGKLVHIGNGEFIGYTGYASAGAYGAMYKVVIATGTVEQIYGFTNTNRPQSSFVLADNGMLYGIGYTGTTNESAIYSFDLATRTYSKVHEIEGKGQTGRLGGMVSASNGLLYGITKTGGSNDGGILFSFNPVSATFAKLFDFNVVTGSQPEASLIEGDNGKLYGVTSYGGANNSGVLFSYDIASSTYTKLFDFTQSTGESPTSPLYQASDGKLYGVTAGGGKNYQGVLYSFDISTNAYSVLHDFFASDGYRPTADPIEATPGVLFGTTNSGGASFNGSVYKYDIASSVFTKVLDGDDTLAGRFISPFVTTESVPSSVDEPPKPKPLSIFPNPCTDYVQIENCDSNLGYRILNVIGQQVQAGCTINGSISVGTLDRGLYIVLVDVGKDSADCSIRMLKQ